MIKAGDAVDTTIENLKPFLEKGDIIIDGGNCHFEDTQKRQENLDKDGIVFMGVGVSGGEEGALKGPCIMPGGNEEGYKAIEGLLTDIAAKTTEGITCCTYLGKGGAGHFVKMVHNGIEYGIMQLIAEIYELFRSVLGFSSAEISNIFSEWNKQELGSFLVEITADLLNYVDEDTGNPLIDMILDKAGQKGTGIWTVKSGLDLAVPIPTISAAVCERTISGKNYRKKLNDLANTEKLCSADDKEEIIKAAYQALLLSEILTYSQGMGLLAASSYELKLGDIAKIWQGGCIIRSKVLNRFENSPASAQPSVIVPDTKELVELSESLKKVVEKINAANKSAPALSASLNYFLSLTNDKLPINLIQAQRDYFGAHTYARTDKGGIYHTQWKK